MRLQNHNAEDGDDDTQQLSLKNSQNQTFKNCVICVFIMHHQSILYELLTNLIGSLLPYYDFILHRSTFHGAFKLLILHGFTFYGGFN